MILDILRNRFSCRQLQDKPIFDEVLQEMLEAARSSPSGGNEPPWCFGVITDPAFIAQIAVRIFSFLFAYIIFSINSFIIIILFFAVPLSYHSADLFSHLKIG